MISSRRMLLHVLLLEGFLLVVAVLWAVWKKIPLLAALIPTVMDVFLGILAGIALLALNYIILEYGSGYSRSLRRIKQLIETDVSPLFRHVNLPDVIGIALISGFVEEVFFRGVLQAQCGIWPASLIFGMAHVWKKTALNYGLYAALVGLVFGGMYLWSHSLWVPIMAHIVNNFVAMLYYIYRVLPHQHISFISKEG